MKLEQCRYLLEINRLHSISAAAQSLHIGQTTLGSIVKRMEEEVGFTIFQRTPIGVVTTVPGERLLELLWEVNVKYEELFRIKQQDASSVPAITVLAAPAISVRLAIPLAAHFSDFNVPGTLIFEDMASELICEHILDNTANLGLAYLTEQEIQTIQSNFQKQGLHIEKLLTDELCALVAKDHRFADRDYLEVQELWEERLTSATPSRRDKILGAFAFHSPHVIRFSSFDDMCRAVLNYGLIGFAPKFIDGHCNEHAPAELKLIPLRNTEKENKMYICLITCKSHNLRYQENIIVSCVREYFQNLKES